MATVGQRIVVALSGGVDSSVAALLLQREGHELVGVTLQLQRCQDGKATRSCCGIDGVVRARAAAARLDVRHYVLDNVDAFEAEVLAPSWAEYDRGRTPSPCLRCNEQIKFGTLLSWARRLGAAAVATGHYARIVTSAEGQPELLRGVDVIKDQSYFLAGLDREQLASIRFPLGALRKDEVRCIALAAGLPTAEQEESQDACLVSAGKSFAEVLRERFGGAAKAGVVVDDDGQTLGQHDGLHRFTVGQRRGLPIQSLERSWVRSIDAERGIVVVTHDHDALLCRRVWASGARWVAGAAPAITGCALRCTAQVRSQHRAASAVLVACDVDRIELLFDEPVRAIAPGQALVLYDGERVLGRGWIDVAA